MKELKIFSILACIAGLIAITWFWHHTHSYYHVPEHSKQKAGENASTKGVSGRAKAAYENARRKNALAVWEDFLKRFSDTDLAVNAEENLETLEFKRAVDINTEDAWTAFQRKYPNSVRTETAREQLCRRVYARFTRDNTILSYQAYIDEYPHSPLVSKAREALGSLRLTDARNVNTVSAYQSVIKECTNTEVVVDARKLLAKILPVPGAEFSDDAVSTLKSHAAQVTNWLASLESKDMFAGEELRKGHYSYFTMGVVPTPEDGYWYPILRKDGALYRLKEKEWTTNIMRQVVEAALPLFSTNTGRGELVIASTTNDSRLSHEEHMMRCGNVRQAIGNHMRQIPYFVDLLTVPRTAPRFTFYQGTGPLKPYEKRPFDFGRFLEGERSGIVQTQWSNFLTSDYPESLALIATSARSYNVRLDAVTTTTDDTVLTQVAMNDADPSLRWAAVARIHEQAILDKIAMEHWDSECRKEALKRVTNQVVLSRIALWDEQLDNRVLAVKTLTDQNTLITLSLGIQWPELAKYATEKLIYHVASGNQGVLRQIVNSSRSSDARKVAFNGLTNTTSLAALQEETTDPAVALATEVRLGSVTWSDAARRIQEGDLTLQTAMSAMALFEWDAIAQPVSFLSEQLAGPQVRDRDAHHVHDVRVRFSQLLYRAACELWLKRQSNAALGRTTDQLMTNVLACIEDKPASLADFQTAIDILVEFFAHPESARFRTSIADIQPASAPVEIVFDKGLISEGIKATGNLSSGDGSRVELEGIIASPDGRLRNSIWVGTGRYLESEVRDCFQNFAAKMGVSQNDDGKIVLFTELPDERLFFRDTSLGTREANVNRLLVPNGHGTVIRFKGRVTAFFPGCTIIGDDSHPLCFVLIRDSGMTYVCGKGTVTTKDGRTITFPDEAAIATSNTKSK